jgi:hypothetical protein
VIVLDPDGDIVDRLAGAGTRARWEALADR